MSVRNILKMGDVRLLQQARPVEDFTAPWLSTLLADLHDTMAEHHGAGLAAPQIGEPWQVVVFGSGAPNPRYPEAEPVPATVLINPILTPLGAAMEDDWEGCLSIPGLRGVVPRYRELRYQGFDAHGQPIDRTVSGFHARVVQHECDHLWGMLYPMRMKDMSQLGFTDVLFPELALVAAAEPR